MQTIDKDPKLILEKSMPKKIGFHVFALLFKFFYKSAQVIVQQVPQRQIFCWLFACHVFAHLF